MEEDIKFIANHYGLIHQLFKLSEESEELNEAIEGFFDANDSIDHLQEEIADVKIMIAQIEYLLGKDNIIKDYVRAKLDRQIERINTGEE